jgi:uncharacterized protein YciI
MVEKKYFVLKLIPSRQTFMMDMTDAEKAIMQQHVIYWKDFSDKGIAIVYGPVADPKGPYGIAVVEVDNEEELNTIIANDPAEKIGKYDVVPMVRAIVRC